MRILLASPYDLTQAGGVTSHVFDLANQFSLLGHEATVTGPYRAKEQPAGEAYRLGSSFYWPSPGDAARINLNPLVSGKVRRLLSQQQFDVFHLHEPFLGYIGASFLRYGDGIKVGTFHTWRENRHMPYTIFGPLVRRWNRLLNGRIAVSESAMRTVNRYIPDTYRVIPNAIYFDEFAAAAEPPEHLADDRPTILFVGRLELRKGVPVLLKAFEMLKKRITDARLVIVGDGTMRRDWQRMAEESGIGDVLFEGGRPRSSLPGYYQRADVFCSPSVTNESFGITLLEAMAAKRPIVATSNNGSSTLGEHDVHGLIVEPRDAFALAEAIEYLLEDRVLANRLATDAQARARQFDWAVVARSILDYYVELGGGNASTVSEGLSVAR